MKQSLSRPMKYFPLAARICLSLFFLRAGITFLLVFPSYAAALGGLIPLGGLLSPILGGLLVAVATLCQLLGGVSLLLGYKVEIGAFLLIIFFIPTTLLASPNFMGDGAQLNLFLRNLGTIGGLLMVMERGAGAVSIDEGLK